jgi:hypothetical protein
MASQPPISADEHQRQKTRHDEALDRVDAQHLQRVELLADLAGAEVRRVRGARDAGEREQKLVDELAAIGVRRPQRGHDRPPGEDQHVPDLLEESPRREKRSIGDVADHQLAPLVPRPQR